MGINTSGDCFAFPGGIIIIHQNASCGDLAVYGDSAGRDITNERLRKSAKAAVGNS